MNKTDFLEQVKSKLGLLTGDVTLSANTHTQAHEDYTLIISQTDNTVDFDFEFLAWLSDVFETRKINIGNRWNSEGCESCGWGAKYEVSLYISTSPKLFD